MHTYCAGQHRQLNYFFHVKRLIGGVFAIFCFFYFPRHSLAQTLSLAPIPHIFPIGHLQPA